MRFYLNAKTLSFAAILFLCPLWGHSEDFKMPKVAYGIGDEIGALSEQQTANVRGAIQALLKHTGIQLEVLLPESLQGLPIEDFSMRVAEHYKFGKKGTDNGALLTIALKERKTRLEVGYGLEGTLTDVRSRHLLDDNLIPHLRSGHTFEGVMAVIQALDPTPLAPGEQSYRPGGMSQGKQALVIGLIGLLLMFLIVVWAHISSYGASNRGIYRRPGDSLGGWDPLGGGGGFSGGSSWGGSSGGGFGGGGASSDW